MYAHIDVVFVAYGHDGLEPCLHVLAQHVLRHAVVEGEQVAEELYGTLVALLEVARDEALRLYHDVLHQLAVVGRRSLLLYLPCLGDDVAVPSGVLVLESPPFGFRPFAFQDVDVEVCKFRPVEVEVACAVGVGVQQVGACPVEHGHEVVAHAVYAFLSEVGERFLVHLYLAVAVGTAVFYRLGDGQRFYNAPAHSVRFDILSEVADFLTAPHLAERHVVQGGDDAFDTYLFQHGKCDLVVLAKPSPCSFHKCLMKGWLFFSGIVSVTSP